MTIRPLAPVDVPEAAAALARAFHDDPAYVYIYPDDADRRRRLPRLMRCALRIALPDGHVYTSAGTPAGAAAFLPPGAARLTATGRLLPILWDAFRLGARPIRRLLAMSGELEKHHPPGPHWYLMVLAVDPARQGEGLGPALVAEVLRRADADGLEVFLETTRERNVGFYRRLGFEELSRFPCPAAGGPTCWTMLRPPRR